MTTINRSNKPIRKDRLRLIASGVQTHFPSGQKILAGQTFNLPSERDRRSSAARQLTTRGD